VDSRGIVGLHSTIEESVAEFAHLIRPESQYISSGISAQNAVDTAMKEHLIPDYLL